MRCLTYTRMCARPAFGKLVRGKAACEREGFVCACSGASLFHTMCMLRNASKHEPICICVLMWPTPGSVPGLLFKVSEKW